MMAALGYGGPTPSRGRAIETRFDMDARFDAGITRNYVDGRVAALTSGKAAKTYVDAQDNLFQSTAYYQAQDALNVLLTAKGVPGGVATLGSDGKVPAGQVPVMGTGTFKGPYGYNVVTTGSTGTTPKKIVEWTNIGLSAINFQPMVFMSLFVQALTGARPVVEVRIHEPAQTTYAAQTLVARGVGRFVNDFQAIAVRPCGLPGAMDDGIQTYFNGGFDTRLTAWMYSSVAGGTLDMPANMIANACAYLRAVTV
jgi:hypothetical protein